jgi:NAD(P)-dependent dehydrogenase (short-subunit alcohol dehydrogenase family)
VLDVLGNNAGTNIPEPFVRGERIAPRPAPPAQRARRFPRRQAAAKKMLEGKTRGGAIINMSSQKGHVGAVNRSVYCMTKHALEGLTKAMALELAPHAIRVVSVAPTFIETPMYRQMREKKPQFAQWVNERIAAGRVGQPEDVAAAVVFAASLAASLVTGTSLVVDGGGTAQ